MTNTTVNPLYMIAGLIVLIVAISFGITKIKRKKLDKLKRKKNMNKKISFSLLILLLSLLVGFTFIPHKRN